MATGDSAETEEHGGSRITITVNTRQKLVNKGKISFDQVVELAFGPNVPKGPNILITIAYHKGHNDREGSLTAGQSVEVREGMVFDVTATDRS